MCFVKYETIECEKPDCGITEFSKEIAVPCQVGFCRGYRLNPEGWQIPARVHRYRSQRCSRCRKKRELNTKCDDDIEESLEMILKYRKSTESPPGLDLQESFNIRYGIAIAIEKEYERLYDEIDRLKRLEKDELDESDCEDDSEDEERESEPPRRCTAFTNETDYIAPDLVHLLPPDMRRNHDERELRRQAARRQNRDQEPPPVQGHVSDEGLTSDEDE